MVCIHGFLTWHEGLVRESREATLDTKIACLFNLYTPLCLILNCICQVVSQKCLTPSCLQVCDNWSGSWSCEYWLRNLHTVISKFDSFSSPFSLWWKGVSSKCCKHTKVFSVSQSLLMQFWSEAFSLFRSWLLCMWCISYISYIWKVRYN